MLSLGDLCVNDRGVLREVGERFFFRDAFEYRHRERVCVRTRRWRAIVAFMELGG